MVIMMGGVDVPIVRVIKRGANHDQDGIYLELVKVTNAGVESKLTRYPSRSAHLILGGAHANVKPTLS